jgi:hypothetical protein
MTTNRPKAGKLYSLGYFQGATHGRQWQQSRRTPSSNIWESVRTTWLGPGIWRGFPGELDASTPADVRPRLLKPKSEQLYKGLFHYILSFSLSQNYKYNFVNKLDSKNTNAFMVCLGDWRLYHCV